MTTVPPSARSSASSWCCASSWGCLAASCWRSTAREFKAVNNKDRNFTRASLAEFIRLADEKLDGYLQRLDSSDAAEQATGNSRVTNLSEKIAAVRERRARCQEMLAELDRTGEKETDLPYRSRQSGDGCTHACRRRLQPCRSRWMLSTS